MSEKKQFKASIQGSLPLEKVTRERDLDITVQESFKSSKQFNIAAAKANSVLGIIKTTFSSRDGVMLTKLYKSLEKTRLRGHRFMLEAPEARLDLRKNSLASRTVTTWNSFPSSVVECDSLNTFKNRIDEHFMRIRLL